MVAYPLKDQSATADTPAATQESIGARLQAAAQAAYLSALNPPQRQAVETLEGAVLVLAGAGTGKTRVLTTRIAHLLNCNRARLQEVLAVTFTNKAAREMKERVSILVGQPVEGMPWLGTFHSIGSRILRRHAELVDLQSNFTVLDTDDQLRLLKQIITAANIDEKRWPARQLAAVIDGWKNRGFLPCRVPAADAYRFADGRAIDLYTAYQSRLKALNAVDFGDLLVECIRLFQQHPDVLTPYQQRFKYILVDEYQDSNVAQYLWLRLLAQGHGNLCCVGDDDQSIYRWRGAEVDNILRFEKDFPGARIIRLERNYRSGGHILAAAAHLISHNRGRLGKTLFTEKQAGEKVTVTQMVDSPSEARAIGETIETLQRHGASLGSMAVLVRVSAQMREFEDRFSQLGLHYRVIGGPRFYERLEIRDALAYFRAVVQPADDLAFERIINTPRRGLGAVTLREIHTLARRTGTAMMRAAEQLCETRELRPATRTRLAGFMEDLARWRSRAETLSHTDLAQLILDESGYTDMWKAAKTADAAGRLENLKELIHAMAGKGSMSEFLEHVALVTDAAADTSRDAISLMTLHAAKGLEFDNVFLPGWEDGLFPHERALREGGNGGLEEERRLAHVGITRAKKRAMISLASSRRLHGHWQVTQPSRFLDELPVEHVELIMESTYDAYTGFGSATQGAHRRFSAMDARGFDHDYETPGWKRAAGKARTARPPVIEGTAVVSNTNENASAFSTGERVFHIKFGYGEITAVDGNKLSVDFDKAGKKRVMASFVERP